MVSQLSETGGCDTARKPAQADMLHDQPCPQALSGSAHFNYILTFELKLFFNCFGSKVKYVAKKTELERARGTRLPHGLM